MKYHCTSTPKLTVTAIKDVEQQELLFIAGENAEWHILFRRHFGNLFTKFNIALLYNQTVMLLGICPTDLETLST